MRYLIFPGNEELLDFLENDTIFSFNIIIGQIGISQLRRPKTVKPFKCEQLFDFIYYLTLLLERL